MRRFWFQPFRRQLVIAAAFVLVPAVGAAVWSGMRAFDERVEDLRGQADVASTVAAAYVNRSLESLGAIASLLVTHPAVAALDRAAAHELFTRTLPSAPVLAALVLSDVNHQEMARVSRPGRPFPIGSDWASRVLATRARVVRPLPKDRSANAGIVLVGYPVRRSDGALVGALGLGLDLGIIQAMFEDLPLPEGSVVTVTDASGVILARTSGGALYVGQLVSASPRRPEQIPSSEELIGVDGVRRMYSNAVVSGGPWVVSVGVPMNVALSKSASLWARSFAMLVGGLIGWVIVAIIISRRFVRSVGHLEAAANRVAVGDLRPPTAMTMPSQELAQLQDAFQLMIKKLDEARAEERQMTEVLHSLQRQVIRQERLAAVGLLVSGVAHEINNPLQAILGFAELLQMQHKLPDPVTADLKLIQKESARACGIIRNLALFARQQSDQAAAVRPADVIMSVAELRQRRLESEDIQLVIDHRSAQLVRTVFTELQQVILNFVVNAEQAILASGRLPGRITIRAFDAWDRVTIEVEDTGPGVPPADEPKLFQPFFTTKPVGQGTGLGLSVSYGIIDSIGGTIGYRRAPAGGAIFYVELPAVPTVSESVS